MNEMLDSLIFAGTGVALLLGIGLVTLLVATAVTKLLDAWKDGHE